MEKNLTTTYVITDIENTDNIICVGYLYSITWKEQTASIQGEVYMNEPDSSAESFIEWNDVTRENLKSWVESKIDLEKLYQKCMKELISKNNLILGRAFHDESNTGE